MCLEDFYKVALGIEFDTHINKITSNYATNSRRKGQLHKDMDPALHCTNTKNVTPIQMPYQNKISKATLCVHIEISSATVKAISDKFDRNHLK